MRRSPLLVLGLLALTGRVPSQTSPPAPSEETIEFFRQNCNSCHTIGGGVLTGPDLKDVSKRRPREWLLEFILDPRAIIDGGDPYAQKLFREARGVYMQKVPNLDKVMVGKLLDLIDAESVAEKPRFAGNPADDRPLTPLDVDLGRNLFQGVVRLANGGPPCISCHTVKELGSFGGGRLGPDLTAVYARLEGRKALAAWLMSPPSNVMRPVFAKHRFTDDERLALVAFLKQAAQEGEPSRGRALEFVLVGFAVAALVLVLFDFLWRNRYRGVRRRLAHGLPARSNAR